MGRVVEIAEYLRARIAAARPTNRQMGHRDQAVDACTRYLRPARRRAISEITLREP